MVNRIQNLRKDSGYDVTDRIEIQVQEAPELTLAVAQYGAYIEQETLADQIKLVPQIEEGLEVAFDGITTKLSINKC